MLLRHKWPGNVRELVNAMTRVTTMVRRRVIAESDLAFLAVDRMTDGPTATDWLVGTLPEVIERVEKELIRRALEACDGNRVQAAERLGIRRQLLYQKLARHGELSHSGTDVVPEADISTAGDLDISS